ncbi:MAG: DUF1648 domain-containing protein [Coriobacteriia bacterium]|nr:DUF1648 domain-containing protein [Coriobacteriia bacterium]MBN2823320.1 DUF1648 domain-containing protein [Coriobacteriia bacterium]
MSETGLSPQARALIEEYLTQVRDALRGTDLPRSEILVDLRTHIEEAATGSDGSPDAVRAIIEDLGPAEQYRETVEETAEGTAQTARRVLGVPYDFTLPSTAKFAARWWNPADPHIFVPRMFGVGWTVNFGAVAVRLGMMRPDDEDAMPFGNVPDRALVLAMVIPTLIAAAGAIAAAVAWHGLPAEVPTHWGISGAPDQWGPKASALGFLLLMGVGPVLLGWLQGFRKGTSKAVRAFWAAGTATFSVLGSGLIGLTIYGAKNPAPPGWWSLVIIVGALVLTFVMLLLMSRLGLRAEWRQTSEPREDKGEAR